MHHFDTSHHRTLLAIIRSRQKQPSCKKRCGPVQNGQYKKSYEIQAGGQEMAVMVS